MADRGLKQCRDRALAQSRDAQTLHARITVQVGDQLCQRLAELKLALTVRAQHQHAGRPLRSDHVAQQQQRRPRCPVQVIEDQQRALFARRRLKQRADGRKQCQAL